MSSLLTNPKVHIYVDDGRRWLTAHPDEKYDLIVTNSTYHWRAHSSTLLSREFYEQVKPHLAEGGVYYFNSTESAETMGTALSVFPYGMRVLNFIAVSDSPIHFDNDLWFSTLAKLEIDGKRLFDPANPATQRVLAQYASFVQTINEPPIFKGLETGDALRRRIGRVKLITDDNMGLEWMPDVEMPWRDDEKATQVASR